MHPSYFGYLFSFSLGEFVFIAWLLAYTALMIWLYTNYNRLKITLGGDHLPLNVALIIPFRNEAINVQRLAIQLAAYIPSSWEITVQPRRRGRPAWCRKDHSLPDVPLPARGAR